MFFSRYLGLAILQGVLSTPLARLTAHQLHQSVLPGGGSWRRVPPQVKVLPGEPGCRGPVDDNDGSYLRFHAAAQATLPHCLFDFRNSLTHEIVPEGL